MVGPAKNWMRDNVSEAFGRAGARLRFRAFSGKVDTGLQKMRPAKEARARFRFNLNSNRSSPGSAGGGTKSLTYPAVDTADPSTKLRIVSGQAHEEEFHRW